LYAAGLRAEADVSDARMQAKIRTHSMRKVPVTIVVGARELEERTASVRLRTGGSWTAPLDEVKDYLLTVARDRRLVLDTP
jgi:threonyl-tRNA synthetase